MPESKELYNKKDADGKSVFFKTIGAKGGSRHTNKPKGFAAMSIEQRRAASLKGVEARQHEKKLSRTNK